MRKHWILAFGLMTALVAGCGDDDGCCYVDPNPTPTTLGQTNSATRVEPMIALRPSGKSDTDRPTALSLETTLHS